MHTIMTKAVHQPITTKVTTVRKQIPITFRPKIKTFESFSIQSIKSVPIPTSPNPKKSEENGCYYFSFAELNDKTEAA